MNKQQLIEQARLAFNKGITMNEPALDAHVGHILSCIEHGMAPTPTEVKVLEYAGKMNIQEPARMTGATQRQ